MLVRYREHRTKRWIGRPTMSELNEGKAPPLKRIGESRESFEASLRDGIPAADRRWRRRGVAEVERRDSEAVGRRIVFTCTGDGKHATLEVGYADERRYGADAPGVWWELHPDRGRGGTLAQITDDGTIRSAAYLKKRHSAEEAYIADGQGRDPDWGTETITASFECAECGRVVRRREGRLLDDRLSSLPAQLGASETHDRVKVWRLPVAALERM